MNALSLYERFWGKQRDALYAMERTGIRVWQPTLASALAAATTDVNAYREQLDSWAGSPLNWASTKELPEFLYERLRLPVSPIVGTFRAVKANKKQARSTTEVALDWIARKVPEHADNLRTLIAWKKATKSQQFLTALPEHVRDGRIHTQLSPRTETGRLSSRNPNLQQIPKHGDKYEIRKAFVASPGMRLVVIDFSQLELYVLAHFLLYFFGDRSLADDLLSEDIHTRTALRCFGDESKRTEAKAVNYGINYGKTEAGLAIGLGISKAEAAEIMSSYFAGYPGVQKFQYKCIVEARATGRITTLLGRHRNIDFGHERWEASAAERKCSNTRIQGSAADIVVAAMMRCFYDKKLGALGARMLLQVHDELIFEAPAENADVVLERASYLMSNPFTKIKLKVPLAVDGAVAHNWLEAH